jgi:hypothetical protein
MFKEEYLPLQTCNANQTLSILVTIPCYMGKKWNFGVGGTPILLRGDIKQQKVLKKRYQCYLSKE